MCGICGYINKNGKAVSSDSILREMARSITHRGPDDEGFYVNGNVALGHRRLSIIDLQTGHQPIIDDSGPLVIVYNGEVYNFPELKTELINNGHSFSTRSDTEIVLKAYKQWGSDCVRRFNGMFALAIWDGRDKSLFLARDRFGKKPLYFTDAGDAFIFASELKSILKHPSIRVEIDRLALGKYFAYDYIPSPRTIIKGVQKLEPGHWAMFKDGRLEKRKYWDFQFYSKRYGKQNLELMKEKLLELLMESVRRRLVSDVPLGVFLSGGIDSSAVVAMMARMMDPKDIKTFSIGFTEKSYDEASSARLVAGHFNTDHREKIVDVDMMLDVLPKIIDIIDEPFADSSIIPTYMVSEFTRQHVKVALGGDGGDELFMGYPSFIAHRIASMYDRVPRPGKRMIEAISGRLPGGADYMSLQFKLNRFLRGVDLPMAFRHQAWIGSFPPAEQKQLFRDTRDPDLFDMHNIYGESENYFSTYPGVPDMDKIEYLYIKTYLPDDILTKVDRASMAASLEVRAPFLDKDMAEFSGSIPDSLKMRFFDTKFILKEAFRGILPDETIKKAKHGFAVPVGTWFRTGLKDMISKTFSKETVERDGIFNYAYVEKLLADHLALRSDNGRKIWSLFICQMWYNKWIKKERYE